MATRRMRGCRSRQRSRGRRRSPGGGGGRRGEGRREARSCASDLRRLPFVWHEDKVGQLQREEEGPGRVRGAGGKDRAGGVGDVEREGAGSGV